MCSECYRISRHMAGRPRSFDREKALQTAVEQFWRNGYEATTIAGLTEAMGISAPSLYAAFGDKDQLFDEVVGAYAQSVGANAEGALRLSPTRRAIAELLRVTVGSY